MCRYATKTYKIHFVCFECRKTFKKPPVEDLAIQNGDWEDYKKVFWEPTIGPTRKFRKENPELVEYLTEKYKNRKEKCPDCGLIMTDLGLDFKAPKKDKVKEWQIIQGLYKSGKVFHTCGCDGIGFVPKNERDYKDYLLKRKLYYQNRLDSRSIDYFCTKV